MSLEIIVLAAGEGKRMRSARPKVLHTVAGRPMLAHVLERAAALAPRAVHVVHGHGGDAVRDQFPRAAVNWVLQPEQLGTGHAVQQAMPGVAADATVLILYGDVPLIGGDTLHRLQAAGAGGALALLTATLDNPGAYGRILRDASGHVRRIVESRDATPEELAVKEINTGFMAAPAARLRRWLTKIGSDNAQGEYYLTDVVALAVAEGTQIVTESPAHVREILGANDRAELAALERSAQAQIAGLLMDAGVTLMDPARIDVRGRVIAGPDCVIDVNVVLEGEIVLGRGVSIGPNVVLRNSEVGDGTRIEAGTVIDGARIGEDCRVGPFARVRPGALLAGSVHVGNFVEIKNSHLGPGAKANHLAYVGDADVGGDVNIGAGTITCNYDGANKHRTVIGDGAFIGSNCELVAPVTIGAGATIGAGSTITRDAPAGELTLSRARQQTVPGWKRPAKGKAKT